MRTHLVATLVAVMLSVAPAAAQEPAPDDIIVTGTRLNEMIREFVGEVSTAQTAEDQIARWNRNVCTQIAGLHQREAQFVADRIAQRAHQVQLRPGGPNCRANVLIFVTPDADRFTQELTRLFPEVFDPNVANMHTQGDQALAAFVSNERPVRWWHVSQTVSREGAIVRNSDPRWRAGTGGTDGLTGLTVVRTNANSRLERATRQDFNRVVIVVDATRAAGQRFDALADYVAMIALSQVDPEADVSTNDTILNLFAPRGNGAASPSGLTTWDVAYLDGLYNARRNAQNARRQEADISRRMRTRDLKNEYLEE